ncbi:MAG: hypothetical protein RLZZ301_1678 [Bacteroidota bacterium]
MRSKLNFGAQLLFLACLAYILSAYNVIEHKVLYVLCCAFVLVFTNLFWIVKIENKKEPSYFVMVSSLLVGLMIAYALHKLGMY